MEVREALDNGDDIPPRLSVHAVAEALTSFLSVLAQPVIPDSLFPTSELDDNAIKLWSRSFLESMPTLNYNVFVYFVSFMREVLKERDTNGSSIETLKTVCLSCLTGVRNEELMTREDSLKRETRLQYMSNVIVHFLTSEDF